jgi:ubiquinone/menaquinone biosynthesis C-methylase UbiE
MRYKIFSEEEFYDAVAQRLLNTEDLIVKDPARFLAGSMDAFRFMMERIGSVKGKKVLDYGCGSGWLGVYLAKQGAQVEGFDVSGRLVEVASLRAEVNGVSHACIFRKMIAEDLEYPDQSFDLVVGISILHHVELGRATYHLQRVMKNGALAIFIEPLGENTLLNWARDRVFIVHHGLVKDKSTEHPLTYHDIHTMGRNFAEYRWREFQLFSMIRKFIGDGLTEAMRLDRLDEWLLRKFPSLKKFCRLVVVEFRKGQGEEEIIRR